MVHISRKMEWRWANILKNNDQSHRREKYVVGPRWVKVSFMILSGTRVLCQWSPYHRMEDAILFLHDKLSQKYAKYTLTRGVCEMSFATSFGVDIITWRHFPYHWPYLREIIAWTTGWTNGRIDVDRGRQDAVWRHCNVHTVCNVVIKDAAIRPRLCCGCQIGIPVLQRM